MRRRDVLKLASTALGLSALLFGSLRGAAQKPKKAFYFALGGGLVCVGDSRQTSDNQ